MQWNKMKGTVGLVSAIFLVAAYKLTVASPTGVSPADAPVSAQDSNNTPGPLAKLGELDGRYPVPLQPMMAWHQKQNMMEHLVAIQRIIGGLANEDWDEVSRASELIGLSNEMQTMCKRMGSGAPGFTDMGLTFHRRADTITEAAQRHDRKDVLSAVSDTLQACTACHAIYRQDVVDAATWHERIDSLADPAK